MSGPATSPLTLAEGIAALIERTVEQARTSTGYRKPLVSWLSADDPGFAALRSVVEPSHLLPTDLLPTARSVVAFFVPFASEVVRANARDPRVVAPEWLEAYVETNLLIAQIIARLIEFLGTLGVRAVAEPPTHNFDPVTLTCRWSHKSVAVLTGLGSFGLHHLVITDSGCAGRFGSLVLDATLPERPRPVVERCLNLLGGNCMECVMSCPVSALQEDGRLDKQLCWQRLQANARENRSLGLADGCGKCSLGPCALHSAAA